MREEGGKKKKKKASVVVSGSNLLSVSWLNKSVLLYFPGTLNNSHTNTHIKRNTFPFLNSAASTDWQKICSSCRSSGEKRYLCVWPGSGGVEC